MALQFSSWRCMDLMACVSLQRRNGSYCALPPPNVLKPVSPHDAPARAMGGASQWPYFKYSDTWQLFINTGTTIITFLMVFLIQNAQN